MLSQTAIKNRERDKIKLDPEPPSSGSREKLISGLRVDKQMQHSPHKDLTTSKYSEDMVHSANSSSKDENNSRKKFNPSRSVQHGKMRRPSSLHNLITVAEVGEKLESD